MSRITCAIAGLITVAGVAFVASAQQSTKPPPAGGTTAAPPGTEMAAASTKANAFVPIAASANLLEIESSKLALDRGQSQAVKDFANHMVSDHSLAATKMKQALSEAKVQPPPEKLSAKDQKIYDALKGAHPATFDKAYIEAQYNAHVEAVNLFSTYAKNGDNQRLKALATDLLPTLQSHLDQIAKLRSS
jgi:putative membrane protein